MSKNTVKIIQVNNGDIQFDLSSGREMLNDFARAASTAVDSLEFGRNEAEVCKKLAGKFDRIFGNGACRKTFGVDIPSIMQFTEFWDKFEPLLNSWLKEMEV